MDKDDAILIKRFEELSRRAYQRGRPFSTEFLNICEQGLLARADLSCPYALDGGYELAERKAAVFGGGSAPIVSVLIRPLNEKFADELTHRDFLGSLMGLGIRREVLGDIVVRDNRAWLFCLESISGFVIEELRKVKHTDVVCSQEAPEDLGADSLEPEQFIAASERADALVSAVFRLSRSRGQELIDAQKVFINGRLVTSGGDRVPPGAVVSARGLGRFIYDGPISETRKGRLRFEARVFR